MHMHIVFHLFGEMREAGTIGGADGVDAALVVFQVEELAGFGLVDPVAVTATFTAQPLFGKLFCGLTEVTRDAFDVGIIECRRHCFAAVGTGEAVDLLPDLLFQLGTDLLKPAGWLFFDPGKETAESAFILCRSLFEEPQIDRLHITHRPKILIQ